MTVTVSTSLPMTLALTAVWQAVLILLEGAISATSGDNIENCITAPWWLGGKMLARKCWLIMGLSELICSILFRDLAGWRCPGNCFGRLHLLAIEASIATQHTALVIIINGTYFSCLCFAPLSSQNISSGKGRKSVKNRYILDVNMLKVPVYRYDSLKRLCDGNSELVIMLNRSI